MAEVGNLTANAPFCTFDIRAGARVEFDLINATLSATGGSGVYGQLTADAPMATLEAIGGINGVTGDMEAPAATLSSYGGGNAVFDALVCQLSATGGINIFGSLTCDLPFPSLTATMLNGSVGSLAEETPLSTLSATGHVKFSGSGAFNALLMELASRGTVPSNFNRYVLHNTEYGYIGKLNATRTLPTITGAGTC